MKNIRLLNYSFRMLKRDWASGELYILSLALFIAIVSLTAVGFFIDRITQGMNQQAAELLAADMVVSSSRPLSKEFEETASRFGLEHTRVIQFRSVVLADDKPKLVEVKAVGKGYPLRGDLLIARSVDGVEEVSNILPSPGEVWVDKKLLNSMNLSIGSTLYLGDSKLSIERVITYEPDRGGDLFSIAPRIMINIEVLRNSRLLGVGSLASYRLLLKGEAAELKAYKKKTEARLAKHERILDVQGGRPEMRSALERANSFLGLATVISVMIAGVAIAVTSKRFVKRHLDASAIMRCFGMAQADIVKLYILELCWLSIIVSILASIAGFAMHLVLANILGSFVLAQLPLPSAMPVVLGLLAGLILIAGFSLAPLLSLKDVSPLRVLRKESVPPRVSGFIVYGAVGLCISVLLYWYIRNPEIIMHVLGGIVAVVLVLSGLAFILIRLISRLRTGAGLPWKLGLMSISRNPAVSVVQIVSFGVGILVLLLLASFRLDILDSWRDSLPEGTPNHFIINIQPDQLDQVNQYFEEQGLDQQTFYPMVRARLIKINGKVITTNDFESERAKHLLTREFNLSWVSQLQQGNRLVAGKWWDTADRGKHLMSVEEGLAKSLGIKMNDVIGFNINGEEKEYRVSSLRKVDWDTFKVNFFTVTPPGTLEQFPANWITSLYLPPEHANKLSGLTRLAPNATIIDVSALMDRVKFIIDKVVLAIEFILIFSLIAGIAVLYAAIESSQDERRYEGAVMRTLGAKRSLLLKSLAIEYTTLGAVAGGVAGLCASLVTWLLTYYVFKFEYEFAPMYGLIGAVLGIVIVGIAGLLGSRRVLNRPPLASLRE